MSRVKTLAVNAALAMISLVLLFFVAESTLRLLVPRLESEGTYSRTSTAPYGYELIPGASAIVSNKPVQINSLGFRDRERTLEKSDGAWRIAVLGDSHTFGEGVADEEVFTRVLEKQLALAAPEGPEIEVLNLGIPGYNTTQEIHLLEHRGLAYSPDLVVILYTLSDVMGSLGSVPPFYEGTLAPRERTGNSAREGHEGDAEKKSDQVSDHVRRFGTLGRYRSLIRRSSLARLVFYRLSTLRAGLVAGGSWATLYAPDYPGWLEVRAALSRALAIARECGFDLVLAIHPELIRLSDYPHSEAHRTIRAFCEDNGIGVLDLFEDYAPHEATALWIHSEDRHPNDEGHRLIANGILRYLLAHPKLIGRQLHS